MGLIEAPKKDPEDFDEVLQLILEGFNVNETGPTGRTPLQQAALQGHYDVCKALLENGAEVNTVDVSVWSALLWAIHKNHVNVVRLLLHNGASLEVKDDKNKRPVDRAREFKLPEIVDVIEKEFPLWLRLYHAARQGNYNECVALLERKALHETSRDGLYCPVITATENGHAQIVKLLLTKGAKINYKLNNIKRNPLYLATKKGHTDIVSLLLNKEGNGNIKVNGDTLLHLATRKNHEDLVRLLILNEVNPNVKDNVGYTPLHIAIINDNVRIVNQLIQHNANVNLATKRGETPLYLACEGGHQQVVQLLLKNRASTDALNEERNTLMDILNSKCSAIEVDAQVKIEILDNIKALLLPPEAANSTTLSKGATSKQRTEKGLDSSDGKHDYSDIDSISEATVKYPLSTFGSMKPDFNSLILDTTATKELNTKMADLSALVLEFNKKAVNLEKTESDLALRNAFKDLNRKMENAGLLKRLEVSDSKYEEWTQTLNESERKQAEFEEEVIKFQSEIPLMKTKFKDVYREITRILNKIDVVGQ